ncbi:YheC/YheD family protein [Bacillus dakarensis]|uniref:YheC/YheD family endospore coat-associated protein n=1 Tax=Robertmurraya dakarensis TaxID=1926278 RepID=UPI0009808E3F|nr:YheC/YheD family protein [Bacillus dakarensis]
MNEKIYNHWKKQSDHKIELHYGKLRISKTLKIDNSLPDDCVAVENKFTESVTLPRDVIYEVEMQGHQLLFGPLIGIMISKSQLDLTKKKLEILKERVGDYETLKGVVFASSHDQIDIQNKLIKGYYYTKNGDWEEGVFPFPKVLINRPFMKKTFYKRLSEVEKIIIFNNCSLSKEKFWRLLSKDPVTTQYLPFTRRLNTADNLIEMLSKYKTVYIKPSNLSKGRGIYQAKQHTDGIILKRGRRKAITAKNFNDLSAFVEKITSKRRYLIQQAVPYRYGYSLVDFRLYLQKDETLDWNCSGIYCRVSRPRSVVTNLKHCQEIVPFEIGLRKYYGLNYDEVTNIENLMYTISKRICKSLEERGQNIADVALDIVIDSQLHIWVLEVQVNYAIDERLYRLPPEVSKKVWQTPLRYAKALLRFSEGVV